MSDDNNSNDGKVDTQQAILDQLKQQNEAFASVLQSLVPKQAAPAQQKVELDPYNQDSVKAFLEQQAREIREQANQTVASTLTKERALNAAVGRLAMDYPEINSDPEVMKAVVAEHGKLRADLKETAEGYELAVERVAKARKLLPKSQRSVQQNDDFQGGGNSNRGSRRSRQEETEVSDTTKTVSELLGRDTSSEDYKKNMAKIKQRNFFKYE